MNTILYDDFAGTASINGTTPDIPLQLGLNWAVTFGIEPSALVNNNGWVKYTPASGAVNEAAILRTGDLATPRGLGVACVVSLQFKAHSVATLNTQWNCVVFYGAKYVAADLYQIGGEWRIRTGTTDSLSETVIGTAALTPGAIYPAQLVIYSDGTSSFTALGKSAVNSTPLPQTNLDTGITGMQFTITKQGEWKLLSVTNEVYNQASLSPLLPTLSATGTSLGITTGDANISPPLFTALGFGGANASTLAPMGTLVASGHDSTGENAANIIAPTPTLSIFMGMGATASSPMQTVSASATGTNWLTANTAGPMGTVSATGTVSGTSQSSITAPMGNAIGYGGMVASVTITGRPTLTASVTAGGALSANITGPMATLPLFEVTREATCSANIIAPMGQMGATMQAWIIAPMATLTAIGTAVVTATYEAYAVNLKHTPRGDEQPVDEVTRYTNFPFTHVVRHQNSYYGVNGTGLYLLEGTTDDAVPISYAVKTGTTDFKQPEKKTVASAYLGGRIGPGTTLTLHVGEGAGTPYSYTTPRGQLAQNYRQAFGKGNKARYYALGLSGSDVLELDNIELDVKTLTRRI